MKSGYWGKNQLRENVDHENKQEKIFPECNGKLHWSFSESNLDEKRKKKVWGPCFSTLILKTNEINIFSFLKAIGACLSSSVG